MPAQKSLLLRKSIFIQIRNPKPRNPKQTGAEINSRPEKSKTSNLICPCLDFVVFGSFGVVSNFGFRILVLARPLPRLLCLDVGILYDLPPFGCFRHDVRAELGRA